jgi:hypothetical protein
MADGLNKAACEPAEPRVIVHDEHTLTHRRIISPPISGAVQG